jgi:hypothetical protein
LVALWRQAPDQEDEVTRKALLSVVAATAAAAAPAAHAHTLSNTVAKQEAQKTGAGLAKDLGGVPVYKCTRKGDHKVDCQISLVTLDGAACVSTVRVSYKNHRAKKLASKVISGPDCSPPEIPIL